MTSKIRSENNGAPWYQDFINRPEEPRKYIAWIAIDDVTVANVAKIDKWSEVRMGRGEPVGPQSHQHTITSNKKTAHA